jgi:hypothetical protein
LHFFNIFLASGAVNSSIVHAFLDKYLSSPYHVLKTVLGKGNIAMNKTVKINE